MPEPKQLSHPKYRPDIDGLRAIAILSVVGFHAFPTVVKGGFVGVDIFFVISGFLISGIVFRSLESGTFAFSEFYARRILRIFPALATVLIVVLSFGWISLSSDEYRELGKHVAGGAGFISNILLLNESGYFDRAADKKPLLHLWSLGIEEQFYMLWPLLVWCAWRMRISILGLITFSIVFSIALNLSTFKSNPIESFYNPFFRFWELLAGAVLAWGLHCEQRDNRLFCGRYSFYLNAIKGAGESFGFKRLSSFDRSLPGTGLIFIGIFFADKDFFPGYWSIIPTLGAFLVISSGPRSWINKTILSNGVLRWVGLISFPLYLWHWPVFAYLNILFENRLPSSIRLLAIASSFFLAWLTYAIIESPIRKGGVEKIKIYALLAIIFVVGCIGFVVYLNNGFSSRHSIDGNDYAARGWHLKGDGIIDCSEIVRDTTSSFCAKSADANVAIIGDSHAGHLFYGFHKLKNSVLNKPIVYGAGSCQPTLGFEVRKGCDTQLRIALNEIKNNKGIEYVILASYYGDVPRLKSIESDIYIAGMQKTLDYLKNSGKKVVFFVDNPALKESAERCQPRPLRIREIFHAVPEFCFNTKESDFRDQENYKNTVEIIKSKNRDVIFYDPRRLFCDEGGCRIVKNGKLLYGDWNHLSIYGSELVAEDFASVFLK